MALVGIPLWPAVDNPGFLSVGALPPWCSASGGPPALPTARCAL